MDSKRRLTAPEWAAILHEQDQSGMSASLFCKEHGIRISSFFSALKRHQSALCLEKREDLSETEKSGLSARRTDSGVRQASATSPFVAVRVGESSAFSAGSDASTIRVQLRSGHQLHVDAGFDADHLRRLIYVLDVQA